MSEAMSEAVSEAVKVESIRHYTKLKDGKPSTLRAFVNFVVFDAIRIIDATIKEISDKDGRKSLKLHLPGVWIDADRGKKFRPSIEVKADLLAAWEEIILPEYHATPKTETGGNGEWRS